MGRFTKLVNNRVYVPILTEEGLQRVEEWHEKFYSNDVHLHIHGVPYTDDLLISGNDHHNMKRIAAQVGSALVGYSESLKRRK